MDSRGNPDVKLPDGKIITWDDFSNAFDPAWVTEELDNEILEKLKDMNEGYNG